MANDATFNAGSTLGVADPSDLVTQAEATSALPDLTDAQLADLPAVITSVSAACEGYCRRPLALQTFDRVYRPGRTRKIWLDTWPVADMQRLKTDLVVPLTVENLDPVTNQVATLKLTATQLQLRRIASGVAGEDTLTLADYPTVTELAAAVNALGHGWQAIVATGLDKTALSELNPDRETVGALMAQAELRIFARDITRYVLNDARGYLELTEHRPEAFRYADKAYGIGFGWSWSAAAEPRHANVRAIYRAGYAVTDTDLAAGYAPAPADLKRAVILCIQATLDATPAPAVVRESTGDASDELEGPPVVIPTNARRLLGRYASKRL